MSTNWYVAANGAGALPSIDLLPTLSDEIALGGSLLWPVQLISGPDAKFFTVEYFTRDFVVVDLFGHEFIAKDVGARLKWNQDAIRPLLDNYLGNTSHYVKDFSFETPVDTGLDNVFDITVTLLNSGAPLVFDVSIVITPGYDPFPGPSLQGSTQASVAENSIGYVLPAGVVLPEYFTGPTGDEEKTNVVWSLANSGSNGVVYGDKDFFDIDPNSGAISFKGAPDFEDTSHAPVYHVFRKLEFTSHHANSSDTIVRTFYQDVTINVTNAIERPTVTLASHYLSFQENLVNASPQPIAPNATVILHENSWAGGHLSVTGMLNDDSVTIANAGVGVGQIGLSQSSVNVNYVNVTYGGVPFATWTSSGAASGLNVTFNAAATTPAVEALLHSLVFGNLSDHPTWDRTLTVALADSAGHVGYDYLGISVLSNLDPPVITSGDTVSIAENSTGIIYQAAATLPDGDQPFLWYIWNGDASLFFIDGQTGALSFNAPPDFEQPLDADHDGVYQLTLAITNGLTTFKTISIAVTDVNEAPAITSAATASFAENGIGIAYAATATDPESTPLTWSIDGADAARFFLDASSGVVSFKAPPNFEAPQDDGGNNVYNVTLTASDGTLTDSKDVAITVTNVNETPVVTSVAAVDFAENGTGIAYQATAIDDDGPTVFTWNLSGPDRNRFTINSSTGAVHFSAPPDRETPRDAGADNIYNITIAATGGGKTGIKQVAITVTDVPTDGTLSGLAADVTFLENTVNATPQLFAPGVTYAAVDTPIGGKLTVSGLLAEDRVWIQSQGSLVLAGNQVYYQGLNIGTAAGGSGAPLTVFFSAAVLAAGPVVTPAAVTALIQSLTYANVSDTPTASRTLSLDVTDIAGAHVNASPTGVPITVNVTAEADAANFTSPGTASFAENGTGVAYQASATADGGPITWSIGGADGALFDIDADSGAVTFKQPPDYDAPADTGADNNYDITVIATAGGVSSGKPVTISVTNVNEQPTIANWGVVNGPVRIGHVYENDVNAQPRRFSGVTFSDPDGNFDGGTLTVSGLLAEDRISILNGGVSIEPNVIYSGGALVFVGLPIAMQIGFDGTSVTANGTAIGTASGGIGNDFIVTLNAAASSAAVDAVIEQLTYSTQSDTPTKFRTLTLDVVDDGGLHAAWLDPAPGADPDPPPSLLMVVESADDPSVITSEATATVAENSTGVVYQGAVTDDFAQPDLHIWSVGGTDAALFDIDPDAGAVNFKSPPNFEVPQDAGGDNVYDIILTATPGEEGLLPGSKAVAITVTNVVEKPILTGLSSVLSIPEDVARSAPQLFAAGTVFVAGDDILDGAHLTVSGLLAEDRIIILNEGNGAGQVGIDGGDVSYGGTVIGSAAGGIGTTLTVTLNGNASEAAVQALIRRLAFADPSLTPTLNRDLVIDVVDATGAHVNQHSVPGVGLQPLLFKGGAFATHPYFVGNPFAGFDAGYDSSPAFVDLNGDGRLDLVVGSIAFNGEGVLSAWRNTPAGFVPLTGADNPFAGIVAPVGGAGVQRLAPAFVDLDGDGKLDLVLGETLVIRAWHNTGSGYTELTGNANPFKDIQGDFLNHDYYNTPAFTDVDNDGDLDLVTGQQFPGILRSYRNNGDGTYTQLTGANDPFADVNEQIANLASIPNQIIDQSAPAFVDLNGDGKLDLVLGTQNRWLKAWLKTDDGYVALGGDADPFAGSQPDGFLSLFSRPAFVDLDGDGRLDVVSGNMDGVFGVVRNVLRPTDILLTVAHNNTAPTGGVFMTVSADGTTVSATNTVADADGLGVITYQWQVKGAGSTWSDLPGVTGDLPTGPGHGYFGTMRVAARYTDGFGAVETVAASGVVLFGGSGSDSLVGGAGGDVLVGFGGLDTLKGGTGDDWYVIDDPNSIVTEVANAGIDTVFSSVSLALRINVENLLLTGTEAISGNGNLLNNVLTGNSANNALSGGAGDDTISGLGGDDRLNGGSGVDHLNGGTGNDAYFVAEAGDLVNETVGEGADTVYASVDFALQAGVEVETLRANAGNTGLTLTGNEFSHKLFGRGGADHLNGGTGDDALYGQAGADTMAGGLGNDAYYIDDAGDVVNESADGGTDIVYSSVNFALQSGTEVETLRVTGGSTGLTLTGNEFSHSIIGGPGGDTLIGGSGSDVISGGAGDDLLVGNGGSDTLIGGLGIDTFYFGSPTDGKDTIKGFLPGTDRLQVSAAGFGGGFAADDAVQLVTAASVGAASGGAGGYFIFDNAGANKGALYWDANGGSGSDALAIATLSGVTSLGASDFHVVA